MDTPAWAHAKLVSADPAKGSTVTAPVATVTLTFNEMVRQSSTVVTVSGPDGVSYSDGPARVLDKNVLQAVKPLPQGAVTVSWKSVSPDGDAISGTFEFTSAVPVPTSAAPSPSPSLADPASPTPAALSPAGAAQAAVGDQGSGSVLWWVLGAVVVVLLLAGGWLWTRRRHGSQPG